MSKWEMVKLGDVLESQQKSKIKAGQGLSTGKYKFFTSSNIQNKFVNEFIYDKESLIFGTGGNASVHFCNSKFATSTDCIVCYNKSTKVSFRYIYILLKGNIHLLENGFKGAGLKHISKEYIFNIEIPLPPLETQKQIANELDKITGLIEKRKQQIEKLDLLVKAKFVEMFGDPVTNEMGWEKLKLSDLGELGRGVSKHRPRNDPKLLNGNYPLIQTGEVANADLYINTYTNTYSELGLKQSKMWKKGTLCITIAANIAKTAILTFDACFPDSIVGFSSNERTNQTFIHFWFAFFQQILESQAPESAQKNINLKILSELDVIIPPLDLQNKFADYVEKVEKTKQNMQKGLEKLEVLYKERMQNYFE